MKNLSLIKYFIVASVVLVSTTPVFAAENSSSQPSILPSNPFYFLKEAKRSAQKALTFKAVKKIELDLKVVNEKFAELEKLEKIAQQNFSAIAKAIDNYSKELNSLQENIFESSLYQDSRFDDFINNFLTDILNHSQSLVGLRATVSEKNQKKIDDLQNKIYDIVAELLGKSENQSLVKNHLEKIIRESKGNVGKQFLLIDTLEQIEKKISDDYKNIVLVSTDNLFVEIQGEFGDEEATGRLFEILSLSPLSAFQKIKIIDQLREGMENEAKNSLSILRKDIFEQADNAREFRKPQAEIVIEDTEKIISRLKDKLVEVKTRIGYIDDLLSRASFNLGQAKEIFNIANNSQAFSQASNALAAARYGLAQVIRFDSKDINSLDNELKSLKSRYDAVISHVKDMELTDEQSQQLAECEEYLAKISDLSYKKKNFEQVIMALREVKILLSRLEVI